MEQARKEEEEGGLDCFGNFLLPCAIGLLAVFVLGVMFVMGPVLWASSPLATQATASAYLVNESAAAGGEAALISLNVTSYANETLSLYQVFAYVGLSNGTVEAVALQTHPGASARAGQATVVLAPNGQLQLLLEPKGSASFYVAVEAPRGSPVEWVSFRVVFVTPSGGTVAATSNAVPLQH